MNPQSRSRSKPIYNRSHEERESGGNKGKRWQRRWSGGAVVRWRGGQVAVEVLTVERIWLLGLILFQIIYPVVEGGDGHRRGTDVVVAEVWLKWC
ncbi:hypothetical protein HanRHA438_Chr06g0261141 [Helianthus annuus]|nr:hypothetical protein HanRHA438_Chr06g0261141 [Helianthus annuus]